MPASQDGSNNPAGGPPPAGPPLVGAFIRGQSLVTPADPKAARGAPLGPLHRGAYIAAYKPAAMALILDELKQLRDLYRAYQRVADAE